MDETVYEDDYDVSNKVLADYLDQFPNENFQENEINCIDNFQHSSCSRELDQTATGTFDNFNHPLIFYNQNQINQYLNGLKTGLSDLDRSFLLTIHLRLLTKLNSNLFTKFDIAKDLIYWNRAILGLFLAVCFSNQVLALWLVSLFVCLMLMLKYKNSILNWLFLKQIITIADQYLKETKGIIYYLREIELVSLANKRQILIEQKLSTSHQSTQNLNDTLNYSFRRLVFNKLRVQFFTLKALNLTLLDRIDFRRLQSLLEIDPESFICCANKSELAPVLQETNDNALDEISDHYSLNCISSLGTLIKLLVSENFKLIQIIEFDSITSGNQFVEQWIFLVKNIMSQYLVHKKFQKLISELKQLAGIITLMPKESTEERSLDKKPDLKHKLSINLRNALLNCMTLSQVKDCQRKLETVNCLKNSFEYCKFYLEKVIEETEGIDYENWKLEKPSIEVVKVIDEDHKNNDVKPCDQKSSLGPIEDVIFEADMSRLIKMGDSEVKLTQEENESNLRQQESLITNKNLFYELKFALKNKRNEWTEREKRAKRINDKGVLSNHLENFIGIKNQSIEFDDLISDHLLENEVTKYKSMLKNRNKGLSTIQSDSRDRLEVSSNDDFKLSGNKKKGYKYSDNESELEDNLDNGLMDQEMNNDIKSSNSMFINEFMAKRNNFFNLGDDNDTEEIVYE